MIFHHLYSRHFKRQKGILACLEDQEQPGRFCFFAWIEVNSVDCIACLHMVAEKKRKKLLQPNHASGRHLSEARIDCSPLSPCRRNQHQQKQRQLASITTCSLVSSTKRGEMARGHERADAVSSGIESALQYCTALDFISQDNNTFAAWSFLSKQLTTVNLKAVILPF